MLSPPDLAGRRRSFLDPTPFPPLRRVDWVRGTVPESRAGPKRKPGEGGARDSAGDRGPPHPTVGARPRSAAVWTRPWRGDSRRCPRFLGGCERGCRVRVPACESPPSSRAARGLGQVGTESAQGRAGSGSSFARGGRVWGRHVIRANLARETGRQGQGGGAAPAPSPDSGSP